MNPVTKQVSVSEFRCHEPRHPTSCRWREFAVANPATRRVVGDEVSWPLTPSRILEYTCRKHHPVGWMFFISFYDCARNTTSTWWFPFTTTWWFPFLFLTSTHVLKLYDGLKDWQFPSPSKLSVTKCFDIYRSGFNQPRHTILTILTISIRLYWFGFDWIGLDWMTSIVSAWVGLDLDCIRLDWFEMDWVRLNFD